MELKPEPRKGLSAFLYLCWHDACYMQCQYQTWILPGLKQVFLQVYGMTFANSNLNTKRQQAREAGSGSRYPSETQSNHWSHNGKERGKMASLTAKRNLFRAEEKYKLALIASDSPSKRVKRSMERAQAELDEARAKLKHKR